MNKLIAPFAAVAFVFSIAIAQADETAGKVAQVDPARGRIDLGDLAGGLIGLSDRDRKNERDGSKRCN